MDTKLRRSDLQEIAVHYGLTVVDFEPIDEGASNSNYVLHTRQDRYVLTIFDYKSVEEVERLERLLLLLADHEFPTSRVTFPIQARKTIRYGNKPVMMKGYIPGRVCQALDATMLYQVGVAMARLHQAPVPDFLPDRPLWELRPLSSIIGQNVDAEYENWLAKRLLFFEKNIPQGLPRGLVHSDVCYDNVLFEGKNLTAIIDFEDAIHYYKVFDLAMGIVGLCMINATMALDSAQALVQGYQRIQELEETEIESLQLFSDYAATLTSCWRYWKHRIHAPNKEKADTCWQMVRIAETVGHTPPAEFLKTVLNRT